MSNEIRSLTNGQFEIRSNKQGQKTLSGYLAVYGQRSVDLGNFTEIIHRGAFNGSMGGDIRLLVNHNWDKPLARTTSGTLQLRDDDTGLGFTATMPNTTYANDLIESLSRGDISGCSFGFTCNDDDWSQDEVNGVTRTLRDVTLHEGSIVTALPAYPQTFVSLRSAPEAIKALLAPEDNGALLAVLSAKRKIFRSFGSELK